MKKWYNNSLLSLLFNRIWLMNVNEYMFIILKITNRKLMARGYQLIAEKRYFCYLLTIYS